MEVSYGRGEKGTIRVKERPEKLHDDLVRDFVVAGHGDLEKVKAMLVETPTLVNAVWDWGGGDWESALGGAAHVGRRDIATFLIEHGAHLDVFAAAMLGKLGIVQAMVTDNPAVVNARGPHGIPLVRHAAMGGEQSAHVLAFLKEHLGETNSETN